MTKQCRLGCIITLFFPPQPPADLAVTPRSSLPSAPVTLVSLFLWLFFPESEGFPKLALISFLYVYGRMGY